MFRLDQNQQQGYNPQNYPPQQQTYYPPPQQQQAYFTPHQQYPPNPQTMQQPGWVDPEGQNEGDFQFDDQTIRKGFIRKVFSILSVSNFKTAMPIT